VVQENNINNENTKKTRIMEAATEIFAKLPYHQVKVEEIATQAGVGKGTIYEYFSSKDDLFFSLMKLSSRIYFAEMAKATTQGKTIEERLRIIFNYHLAFIEKNADMARILIAEKRLPQEECTQLVKEQRKQLKQFISGLLAEGIASGEFRTVDPDVISQGIMGTLAALWGHMLLDDEPIQNPGELTEKILDFFLHGLQAVQEKGV
jgi:TetR/AcrR family fatty acid metabolism transcriptional regulator